MKTRLTHARANVSDLAAAIRWYTGILEFEVESTWPPDKPNYAHFVEGEGATFAIMVAEPVPSGGRFNFNVNDVDELWSRTDSFCSFVSTTSTWLCPGLGRSCRSSKKSLM